MSTTTLKRPPRTLMEVFKNLPEGTLAQLIENTLIMTPSPSVKHQEILNKINTLLYVYVDKNRIGQVLTAPMDVYLDQKNAFQPDIIFVSNDQSEIMKEDGIYGAPALIIEILSPATAKYDLEEKKDVYERCGVREYWVVDPADKTVQGFFLKDDGHFEESEKNKGVFQSLLLDKEFQF